MDGNEFATRYSQTSEPIRTYIKRLDFIYPDLVTNMTQLATIKIEE
jgi:hypothetical protein